MPSAILNQRRSLRVCQKLDILYQFVKFNGVIAEVNLVRNSSNVSLEFVTTILNLGLCKRLSDFATLKNLPNTFSKF